MPEELSTPDSAQSTILSPEATAAIEKLLKDYPHRLLHHRCCLVLAEAEEPAKLLMQDHPKEVRDAFAHITGIAKRYVRVARGTGIMPPEMQAAVLVGMLLNPDALMLVNEE